VRGDLIVYIHDDRLVVTTADALVLASPELVDSMLDEANDRVQVTRDGDRTLVTFGTEGEGLGVVTYEVGGRPRADPSTAEHLRPLSEYVTLRRVA